MSEPLNSQLEEPTGPDQPEDLSESDENNDLDMERESEDEPTDGKPASSHVREGAEHHASFTVRHGLQEIDPGTTSRLLQAGIAAVVVGAAFLTLRRLFRRKPRLCIDNAWAWTTGQEAAPQDRMDLTRPLLGFSIGVAEKCVGLIGTSGCMRVCAPECKRALR